jgi:hypothetical protein
MDGFKIVLWHSDAAFVARAELILIFGGSSRGV